MTSMRNPSLTFIVNAIKASGGKLPKALESAITDQQRITDHIRDTRSKATGYTGLASAWVTAVLEGRDPADDRDVFRAMLIDSIAGGDIDYAAGNVIAARTIDAMADEQHGILTTMKTAFDTAGRTLTNAHSILGNVNLDDTTAIFQLGPVAVQAYQDAQETRRVARVIDVGWDALNGLTRFAGGAARDHATRWADLDINTWERVRRVKDAWALTVAGGSLDLAIDSDTLTARVKRLDTERDTRDNAPRTRRASSAPSTRSSHARLNRRDQVAAHMVRAPRAGSPVLSPLAGLRGFPAPLSGSWMNRPIGVKTADYQAS